MNNRGFSSKRFSGVGFAAVSDLSSQKYNCLFVTQCDANRISNTSHFSNNKAKSIFYQNYPSLEILFRSFVFSLTDFSKNVTRNPVCIFKISNILHIPD